MANRISRTPDYSDIDLSFTPSPINGDLVIQTGKDAVKRSIYNLIMTNFYDRPFRSYVGSNVQRLLFEPVNALTSTFIKDAVREVIINWEPRVKLDDVVIRFMPDDNGFAVTLFYTILNRGEPVVTSLFLERIR